jgi:hypothetical protein
MSSGDIPAVAEKNVSKYEPGVTETRPLDLELAKAWRIPKVAIMIRG